MESRYPIHGRLLFSTGIHESAAKERAARLRKEHLARLAKAKQEAAIKKQEEEKASFEWMTRPQFNPDGLELTMRIYAWLDRMPFRLDHLWDPMLSDREAMHREKLRMQSPDYLSGPFGQGSCDCLEASWMSPQPSEDGDVTEDEEPVVRPLEILKRPKGGHGSSLDEGKQQQIPATVV